MKLLISKLSTRELIRVCNQKLISAARDLAEFTKRGINANFIVSLAHRCEDLESLIEQPFASKKFHELRKLEESIVSDLAKMCDMGMRIWGHMPHKFNEYRVEIPLDSPTGNTSISAA